LVILGIHWIPLFYYFWRSVTPEKSGVEVFWAIPLGCVAAFVRFLVPDFIGEAAGGFGVKRFIGAFVDYAALPIIFPVIAAFVIGRIRESLRIKDLTSWILVALVPVAAVRSAQWGALAVPLRLLLVPILWSACAVGIFPAMQLFKKGIWFKILALLIALGLLFLASLIWFAFFCNHPLYGFGMLLALLACPVITLIILIKRQTINN
jgi:hypothetical protein